MRRYCPSRWMYVLLVPLLGSLTAIAQRVEVREADADAVDGPAGGEARAAAADGRAGDAASPDLDGAEARIVDLTNEFRSKEGRQPVKTNKELHAAAQYFADYMARTGRYGHTADGNQPSERARQHGYDFCLVSENIAYQYNSAGFATRQLAQQFTQGWIDSPGHRKNMLEPDVVETGVAVARSEKGVYYAVQMFGRPKSMQVEFTVSNRSGRPVQYVIGDQRFSLPPRVTRTHTRCRPSALTFRLSSGATEGAAPQPGGQKLPADPYKPKDGDSFVVVGSADGKPEVRLERADRRP